jgi:hypothetical protein|mmetsp:Transcript_69804/g.117234  ORF Transcript_69804/g.117234 Transcript_69804/m.117234 type:complete len:135 (-) Transcript_69804:773-1177(-)
MWTLECGTLNAQKTWPKGFGIIYSSAWGSDLKYTGLLHFFLLLLCCLKKKEEAAQLSGCTGVQHRIASCIRFLCLFFSLHLVFLSTASGCRLLLSIFLFVMAACMQESDPFHECKGLGLLVLDQSFFFHADPGC